MADFMYQWAQQTWREYDDRGWTGKPLDHIAGNRLRSAGIVDGDRVYIVGQDDGRLMLIGRMVIDGDIVGQSEAESRAGRSLFAAADHAFGWDGTRISFKRIVSEHDARAIEALGGGLLDIDEFEYRLSNQALRTIREISPASARILDRRLEGP